MSKFETVFKHKDYEFNRRELIMLECIEASVKENKRGLPPSHAKLLKLMQNAGEKLVSTEQTQRTAYSLRNKTCLRNDLIKEDLNLVPTAFGYEVLKAWKKATRRSIAFSLK